MSDVPMSKTGLLRAYGGLTQLAAPVLPLWLARRARAGKEDPARRKERYGRASLMRPEGTLFWLHGASVGEVTMLLPLIDHIGQYYPRAHILVTSGTVTSAKLLETRLPARAMHQYAPLDTPKATARFLAHWKPDLALWAESEIWPNLILQTKAAGVPMALINARLSAKSIEGWSKRKSSALALFNCFDLILAGDSDTQNGLSWLLGKGITMTGNLKDAAAKLPAEESELKTLRSAARKRPVWCAASTHEGEEQLILAAHRQILKAHPKALLILAPRHPERRAEISPLLEGFTPATRSRQEVPRAKNQVYLFDTIGEMGLAYSVADISFVCGSLVKGLMGHNPLEPARFGNAVLTGAHIASFADSYKAMIAFNAAQRILSPDMIGQTLTSILSDKKALQEAQQQALHFAQSRDEVLATVWQALTPLLPEGHL